MHIWTLLACLALVTFLSLNPWVLPDPKQAIGIFTWDLLDHAAAYAILAFLMLSVWIHPKHKLITTLLAVMLSSIFGFLLELGQFWLTSVRYFSCFDAYANVFGSFVGVAMFWYFRMISPRFRNR
jgi:VanZ family protein